MEAGLPRPDRASRLSRSLEALTLRYRVALVTAVSSRRLPAAAVLAGVPSERRVGWPWAGLAAGSELELGLDRHRPRELGEQRLGEGLVDGHVVPLAPG